MQLAEISAGSRYVDGFQDAVGMHTNVFIRTSWRSAPVAEFASSVVSGLSKEPRELECRYLYDTRGSELYERITEQPEYYPARTEATILAGSAGEIRQITGPVTILELGSGSSCKTHSLLEPYLERNEEQCYVPVDVSESALKQATREMARRHERVQVVSVHGTYEMAMRLLGSASPAMAVFLGSSIGNFKEDEEDAFWSRMSDEMLPGDFFLLGVDLVKDERLLHAAYNDSAGVTAAFTKNLFVRMNRELGSGLDIEEIEHQARYVSDRRQVEIHARFLKNQTLHVEPLGRSFDIRKQERILVEVSRKYRIEEVGRRLASYGFRVRRVFTDDRNWFALMLLQRLVI